MEGKKSQNLSQPRAILVFGAPASGKTTFCEKFSQQFRAPYYDLTKKAQLVARFDSFTPNTHNSSHQTREYSTGLNYFIKGQALKIMLNYVFREDNFAGNSHRIIVGTQVVL